MGFRRKIQDSPKVDLTPMIDVVFLLLIFFMISTTFIEQPGLTINLPESGADQIEKKQRDLHVYLTASGDIYLDTILMTKEALGTHLSGYKPAERSGVSFILMADQEARHGLVVELMDMARSSGFDNLAIATDPESSMNIHNNVKEGLDE